jgi:DUF1365 family protein
MDIEPQILFGRVMHSRLFPRKNAFQYGIYYLSIPLSRLGHLRLAHNRFAPLSFHSRDHGPCDGGDLGAWAREALSSYGLKQADGEIVLICMPRIFGYVFNPVSFWLCLDKGGQLRAVLCEVHNTFGERHTYLCAHTDHRPIAPGDTVRGEKLFHVSPFLERAGFYDFSFRYDPAGGKFSALIDYFDSSGQKQLVTALSGALEDMNAQTLRKAFRRYPLVTFKAIMLIHWQAVKLLFRKQKYFHKPPQMEERESATDNLTKM